ncbi:DUF6688 family protein [Paenibacillus dakarensis]|uniref:DUF6688 family protein n=1 Tax=Paenibacillus dakarensis TaxID=1527293 RepID=UPI0012E26E9C|nr:DUF6688 family protein [Paenibacillus dakarensis]
MSKYENTGEFLIGYASLSNEYLLSVIVLLILGLFGSLIILEQYTPRLHRVIRRFYDNYGYPISKHINLEWSADVVYLWMKPLEWQEPGTFLSPREFLLVICDTMGLIG